MFLENRRIGPAVRAVELGDQWFRLFDTYLVDAVLVAVECQNAGIAEKADALHSVEDQVGGKGFEGVRHVSSCCAAGGRIMLAWYPTAGPLARPIAGKADSHKVGCACSPVGAGLGGDGCVAAPADLRPRRSRHPPG
ncbi:hypothetical protein D3C84_950090 [compost metagenome]